MRDRAEREKDVLLARLYTHMLDHIKDVVIHAEACSWEEADWKVHKASSAAIQSQTNSKSHSESGPHAECQNLHAYSLAKADAYKVDAC